MSPRPRKKGNLDLPPHVEANPQPSGKTYYRYVLPNNTRKSLGTDRQKAIDAGLALNITLSRNPDIMARVLSSHHQAETSPLPPLKFAIEKYKQHLDKKGLAASTREEQNYKLANYMQLWGDRTPAEITLLDVAGFLNGKSNNSYVKHRILLIELWSYLTHQGWATENIANLTMEGIVEKKQRTRHTPEALDLIRSISPDYLQRAIDLARHSVQRREDLVLLHRSMINIPANTLTVLQQKSRNYATPVYIEIDMHPELQKAVIACLSTSLAFTCPYLLHYRPKRMTPQIRDSKPHHLAMTPDFLTREFGKYRDLAKVYAHLSASQRPSFHDIRALGLYEITQQYGKAYAQALAGHATEGMTDHYIAGHEEVKPVRVSFR